MAETPCCYCQQLFLGSSVKAFWAWYEDADVRMAFQQTAMVTCAQEHWTFLDHAIDRAGPSALWPATCPLCDAELDGDRKPVYVTLYKGKTRRDLVVPCCSACFGGIEQEITIGAVRLPERNELSRSGGAPAPGQTTSAWGRDDLPW